MPEASFGPEQGNDVLIFPFDTDGSPLSPHQVHSGSKPFEDAVGQLAENLFIFMQQRFALGGVDHHRIGLAGELHMGREPGPTRSHHSCLSHLLKRNLYHLYLTHKHHAQYPT